MTKVINFGSLNIDKVYQLPHIVRPGETISSTDYNIWCGGKGGNQSIALARAGAAVSHAGCVGNDGVMLTDNLRENGVNTDFIKISDKPSGHAIIQVDEQGENSIILYPGANCTLTPEQVDSVIASAEPGAFMLLQNVICNTVSKSVGERKKYQRQAVQFFYSSVNPTQKSIINRKKN